MNEEDADRPIRIVVPRKADLGAARRHPWLELDDLGIPVHPADRPARLKALIGGPWPVSIMTQSRLTILLLSCLIRVGALSDNDIVVVAGGRASVFDREGELVTPLGDDFMDLDGHYLFHDEIPKGWGEG